MSTELVVDSVDLRAVFLDRVGAMLWILGGVYGKSFCEFDAEYSKCRRGFPISRSIMSDT